MRVCVCVHIQNLFGQAGHRDSLVISFSLLSSFLISVAIT